MTALVDVGFTVVAACALLGVARASYYRRVVGAKPRSTAPIPHAARRQPAALTEGERERILDLLNSPEHADLSLCQAFYRALDAQEYVASLSSWYRVARAVGQVRERRRQANASPKKIPELTATGPSQVWSWDITKLRTPRRGAYLHLYMIIDVFSRKIVGWRVEEFEDQHYATEMINDAVTANARAPRYLHADNGAAMRSTPVGLLLEKLGIGKSFSRPRVSNDNPYSEALFKTLKYGSTFPDTFNDREHAEAFCRWFVTEYNTNHRHSGIGWHTPDDVHHRRTSSISARRRRVLDRAWRQHPERFTARPKPPTMPKTAGINDHRTNRNQRTLSHTG